MTAQPMPAEPTPIERITSYLCGGGLFNPELANHNAVRDLLIDCRDELTAALARAEAAEIDAKRYRALQALRPMLLLTGLFGNGCVNRTLEEADAAIDAMAEG